MAVTSNRLKSGSLLALGKSTTDCTWGNPDAHLITPRHSDNSPLIGDPANTPVIAP